MKKLNLFTLFVIGILITSCSKDDNEKYTAPKYIKEVIQPDTSTPLVHSFKFNRGLLISATGNTILAGKYEYDSSGRLKSKTKFNTLYTDENTIKYKYTYEYDSENRIIRQNKIGTNDYIELTYQPDKVITKRFYEYENEGNLQSSLEKRELQLDSQGRIIKMINLDPEQSYSNIEYEEYLYNSKGDITEVITKRSNNPFESVNKYEYDDKINPYYIAFEKYYNLTYYLTNFNGVALSNSTGLTPNNIVKYDKERVIINYEYNNDGYPISVQRYLAVIDITEPKIFIEYY